LIFFLPQSKSPTDIPLSEICGSSLVFGAQCLYILLAGNFASLPCHFGVVVGNPQYLLLL